MSDHLILVCIPGTLADSFTYQHSESLKPGVRVRIDFCNRDRWGIVIGETNTIDFPKDKLKPIQSVLDEVPLIDADSLWLIDWVSRYYHAAKSEVMLSALPKRFRQPTPMRARKSKTDEKTDDSEAFLVLHEEQAIAVNAIHASINQYQCFLLFGITGSGKTEVYFHLIAQQLALKRQVLILVPEIGLTPQWLQRFQKRFKQSVVLIHSQCTEKERYWAWEDARSGAAGVVIGTRSAVFTPFLNLGLIIIDEEHDVSFKQMDGVRYSARDVALVRAHYFKIPIVLGSATPSLEMLMLVDSGKAQLLTLKHRAQAQHPLRIEMVDLRQRRGVRHGLAQSTRQKIETHLARDEQVLIFINRRGYAPLLMCPGCGWKAPCHACDGYMTYYRKSESLKCHHCGASEPKQEQCPSCNITLLIPVGVGTQGLETHLQVLFPDYEVVRVDRDEIAHENEWLACLEKIHRGDAQLIVATQMMAKGHHIPKLSLVVVVDADQGLYGSDFRSAEHMGQLLVQVAGRAGRADHPGTVMIQTHYPNHPYFHTLFQEGYAAFARILMDERKKAHLPPFQYAALVQVEHRKLLKIEGFLKAIKAALIESGVCQQGIRIWGPAPASMARKAHHYRLQLWIQAEDRTLLHQALMRMQEWIYKQGKFKSIRYRLDIDPRLI